MILREERWPFKSHSHWQELQGVSTVQCIEKVKLEKEVSYTYQKDHQSLNMTLNLKNVQVP
jgi:hypothetical protein